MPNQSLNPIRAVNGATIPCPSAYTYKLSDVSAADAGRTEDTTMDKMRIGQCVHLELSWSYLTTAEVAQVLTAFNPEYFNVTFLDALSGTYQTREFYAGDRSAPMYNNTVGRWTNVSFNIIERSGRH